MSPHHNHRPHPRPTAPGQLSQEAWRIFRIIAEFVEGFEHLAEILTLVQTGKSRRIPIVLVDSDFWRGLLDWFREQLAASGAIADTDLDLVCVVDKPAQVVDAIFAHYEDRGFEPSDEEREVLLQL